MFKSISVSLLSAAIFTLSLFSSQTTHSQSYLWGFSIGDAGLDRVNAVATDPVDGSIYIAGLFFDAIDCVPGAGTLIINSIHAQDGILIKFDANGNYDWATHFGGVDAQSGVDIVVDDQQYISVLVNEHQDFAVYKFDKDGNAEWYYTPAMTSYAYGSAMALDSEGSTYVSGTYQDTLIFDNTFGSDTIYSTSNEDRFLIKINEAGHYIWSQSIGSINCGIIPEQMLVADGHIYSAGMHHGGADFDPSSNIHTMNPEGSTDIYIMRMDTMGNFEWVKSVGGPASDQCGGLAIDDEHNLYITGHYEQSMDADPSTSAEILTSSGNADFFVLKLDSLGDYQWVKDFGGSAYDLAEAIAIDPYGDLYITGNFGSTVDFDPGAGISNLTVSGINDNGFVLKLTNNGDYIWAGRMTSNTDFNSGYDLCIDFNNDLIVVGDYMGDADIDPTSGADNHQAVHIFDIFAIKIRTIFASTEEIDLASEVQLYPNPTSDYIYVPHGEEMTIDVYNLNGQHIQRYTNTNTIDLSTYPSNHYLILIEYQGKKFNKRVTKI